MNFSSLMITYYAHEQTLFLLLAALLVATVMGAIADRVMGSASFGTFGNSALIAMAIAVAVAIDNRGLARLMPEETLRIGIMATTIATGLLLTLASLRSWLAAQMD